MSRQPAPFAAGDRHQSFLQACLRQAARKSTLDRRHRRQQREQPQHLGRERLERAALRAAGATTFIAAAVLIEPFVQQPLGVGLQRARRHQPRAEAHDVDRLAHEGELSRRGEVIEGDRRRQRPLAGVDLVEERARQRRRVHLARARSGPQAEDRRIVERPQRDRAELRIRARRWPRDLARLQVQRPRERMIRRELGRPRAVGPVAHERHPLGSEVREVDLHPRQSTTTRSSGRSRDGGAHRRNLRTPSGRGVRGGRRVSHDMSLYTLILGHVHSHMP